MFFDDIKNDLSVIDALFRVSFDSETEVPTEPERTEEFDRNTSVQVIINEWDNAPSHFEYEPVA